MSKKTLFLIDGSAIAYRSYYAFINNPLTNSKGQNVSAVYGFLRFLFMIQDNEKPDYLSVVFDPKGPTFRHKQYAEYKATRQKMPDDMRDQLPILHHAITALNIPLLEVDGYEADDVIGTLAKQAQCEGFETYVVSGDKDFMQLVNDDVKLYQPSRRVSDTPEVLGRESVENKIGLPPDKIVDYLGLMGDSSDNVPGVKGVGAKTAVKLLVEFGNLEAVLENADKVGRANVRENLKSGREMALLSKKLVRIDTDVPLDVGLETLKCVEPDFEELLPLLQELEFNTLIDRYQDQPQKTLSLEVEIVDNEERLQNLIGVLRAGQFFAVTLQTTHPDPLRGEIVGLTFSTKPGKGFYLPINSTQGKNGTKSLQLARPGDLFEDVEITPFLQPIFEDVSLKKTGHDLKHDMLVLSRYGVALNGASFDTMLASYLINPTFRQHNLEALAREYLGRSKSASSDLLGKGKKQMSLLDVSVQRVADHACEEADIALCLTEVFRPKLQAAKLDKLLNEIEIPLTYVLADVEHVGVSLDLPFLESMSKKMSGQIGGLISRIHEMAGEEFNINSTQQLGQILFEKLKLPRKKRTKTGYSTDAAVLEELAKIHDLPRTLLEYRELTKLKSTYVDALPNLVNPDTGRLHTSYNQTVAATGRLSSSDPNLQNIPIRTEMGREIRRAFIPADSDHVILDADYSQVELRIMAHLSQDPVLLEAFTNGEDIHSKTASLVFQIPPEDLDHEHRRRAKEINFGIMYGMGVYGLASRLHISTEEARDFISSYFALYAKVKEFVDRMHAEAEEKGFVTTMLNRRRYLPEIHSKNFNIREFAKRTAVNTPIQGTAAELIKIAMINIWRKLRDGSYQTRMIMQVHDELVFETPQSEVEAVKRLVKEEMEGALPLDVPIKVDIGVGRNWLEAH